MPVPSDNESCGGAYYLDKAGVAGCAVCDTTESADKFTLPATWRSLKQSSDCLFGVSPDNADRIGTADSLADGELAYIGLTSVGGEWQWEDRPFDDTMVTFHDEKFPQTFAANTDWYWGPSYGAPVPAASDHAGEQVVMDSTGHLYTPTALPEGGSIVGCICETYSAPNCEIPGEYASVGAGDYSKLVPVLIGVVVVSVAGSWFCCCRGKGSGTQQS